MLEEHIDAKCNLNVLIGVSECVMLYSVNSVIYWLKSDGEGHRKSIRP